MFAPYVVPQYPHITPLGYLDTSSSRLPSYVLPHHSSKTMSEHRSNIRNRRSNEANKKIRYVMIRREGVNQHLVVNDVIADKNVVTKIMNNSTGLQRIELNGFVKRH